MKRCYCLLMLLLFLTLMSFSQTDLENRNFLSFEGETFVSVTSGENLTINYEIPVELLDQNPMIGIFKAGSDFDSSHVLKNTMIFDAVGKTLFYSPEDEGQYIVCIYNQDEKLSDPITFEVAKKELEVTEETQVETEVSTDLSQLNTTLEIETEAVFPDELLTVHCYEAPGFETDWIGIYEVGDTEGYIIDWQYTDGSENGSLKFNAPYEPGNYIF